MASSPLVFAFSRLALLEVPMVAFALAAVMVAPRPGQKFILRSILAGCLAVLAMLIKSSALFLLPALCVYIFQQYRLAKSRRAWLPALLPAAVFFAAMAVYTAVIVLPHRADFHTLSGQNGMVLHWKSLEKLVRVFYRTFTWVDPLLSLLAAGAVAAALLRFRDSMARSPLFLFSIAWALGAIVFSVLHFDAGPRYFVLMVVPVVVLSILLLDQLDAMPARLPYRATAAVVALATLANIAYVVRFMAHPTIDVATKLRLYHPGWAGLWSNDTGMLKTPPIATMYRVTLVHSWAVMDDPVRSHLLLYRLQPK